MFLLATMQAAQPQETEKGQGKVMTWANRIQPIKLGDTVGFTAKALLNTGLFNGDVARARGRVIALHVESNETLAEVAWDQLTSKINVVHLQRNNERGFAV
jgi:hypothetical protein